MLRDPPCPHFPPPCALLNEDSPMQLKPPASRRYCMTNRAGAIPHGLSSLQQEGGGAGEIHLGAAGCTDRDGEDRRGACVRLKETDPLVSAGNGREEEEEENR